MSSCSIGMSISNRSAVIWRSRPAPIGKSVRRWVVARVPQMCSVRQQLKALASAAEKVDSLQNELDQVSGERDELAARVR